MLSLTCRAIKLLRNSGVPNHEIWVDSVPFCDKDVITVQYNDNQVTLKGLFTNFYF